MNVVIINDKKAKQGIEKSTDELCFVPLLTLIQISPISRSLSPNITAISYCAFC